MAALPHLSDSHLLCILGIRRLQHGEDGLDDELSVQGWHPVLVDRLRADFSRVRLHARVVNLGHELDLRWLEGVVVREVQVDLELASDEGGTLGSVNDDVPDGHVILRGVDSHSCDWGTIQVAQFLKATTKTTLGFDLCVCILPH